jgi:hypothetical protein
MMKDSKTIVVVALALAILSAPAMADDLTGATALVCSSSWANVCTADEVCESGPPWGWNIPQFVEVDLEEKTLSTTEASGENRLSPAEVLVRDDGLIFIQGREYGRAFSIVISEATGRMSASIAAEDVSISVFGACTPLASGR